MGSRSGDREREVIPQKVATRVLQRASELDAAQRTSAAVDDLRAAAAEAGISATAFDTALAEVQAQEAGLARPVRPRRRLRRVLAGVAALVGVMVGFGVLRTTASAVPILEQAFTLRCLSASQAAAFIRPAIENPGTLKIVSSPDSPGILTVFGTTAQLQQVRSVLDQHDSCPLPR